MLIHDTCWYIERMALARWCQTGVEGCRQCHSFYAICHRSYCSRIGDSVASIIVASQLATAGCKVQWCPLLLFVDRIFWHLRKMFGRSCVTDLISNQGVPPYFYMWGTCHLSEYWFSSSPAACLTGWSLRSWSVFTSGGATVRNLWPESTDSYTKLPGLLILFCLV